MSVTRRHQLDTAAPVALRIDLGDVPPVLVPAIALIAIACVAKTATGWIVSAGLDVEARLRAGTALIAHGEFSIVIAGLAVKQQLRPDLAALAATLVLATALLGPLATPFCRRPRSPAHPGRSDNGRPAKLSISHFAVSGSSAQVRAGRMIERLAAAYGAGELPDYMLGFVDSLRTRTTRATP